MKRALREVSVEGCEVIGKGFYGTVYRIDEETIVKVYESPDSLPMIQNEQRLAKLAFVKGVPTAISYDTVKVGNSYGSVFELLRAISFNDLLKKEPDNLPYFMGIPSEWGERIWQSIIGYYFDSADEERLLKINDKIRLLAMVRFLYIITTSDLKNGELGKKRIKHVKEHIEELIETVSDLNI